MLRFLNLIIVACLLSFGMLSLNVSADTLESVMMPGKVIQGHAKWEDNCQKCHKKFDKEGQNTLCKDCHKDINQDVAQKRGFHGKMKDGKNCAECHTEHKGRAANIVILEEKSFKHTQTEFQLKGGHMADKVKCADCHKPKIKFRDAPITCIGCHKKDDKHKASLGDKCADCHVEKSWKDITFDHNKSDFPLKGAHAETKVKCSDCHKDNLFKQTPKDCYSCHKKDDDHKGVFGQKCQDCHAEKSWKETHFDHKQQDGHFAINRPVKNYRKVALVVTVVTTSTLALWVKSALIAIMSAVGKKLISITIKTRDLPCATSIKRSNAMRATPRAA
jgi:hypothetical protein